MASPFILDKDINGNVTFFTPVCVNMVSTSLTANVAQNYVIPQNFTRALFSYSNGADVYVDFKNTANLPSGSFSATTAELNCVGKYGLSPGSTLSFISPVNCYVHISFFP